MTSSEHLQAPTCLISCGPADLLADPGPWSPHQLDDQHFTHLDLFNENFNVQSLINETEFLFDLNSLNEEKNESAANNNSVDLCLENIDLECLLGEIPTGLNLELSLSSESSSAAIESSNACSYLDYETSTYSVSSSSESEHAKQVRRKRRGKTQDSPVQKVSRGGKVDKKESNKAAAVRYRCKKALEKDSLFAECELYDKKNAEMKSKIGDLENEIDFIKSLLVQAFLAKNSNAAGNSLLSMMPGLM